MFPEMPRGEGCCSLVAHEVVVGLGGIVQAAGVVESDVVALLGEVNTVSGDQSLLFDAHCECGW